MKMKKRWELAAFGVAVMMSLSACGASEDVPETDSVAVDNEVIDSDADNSGESISFEAISFTIPEGWEGLSEDNAIVFTPGGDAEAADCFFSIRYFANTTGWVDEWLTDREERARALEEADDISTCMIEDMGKTFMGRTVKVEMTGAGVVGSKEGSYMNVVYYAEYAKGLYIISLSYPLEEGASTDTGIAEQVKAVDDMFWKTGKIE